MDYVICEIEHLTTFYFLTFQWYSEKQKEVSAKQLIDAFDPKETIYIYGDNE